MQVVYLNFWRDFTPAFFWLSRCVPSHLVRPLVVSGVFCSLSNIEALLAQKKAGSILVLLSLENFYHPAHVWWLPHLAHFDLVLGLNDIKAANYVRTPYYLAAPILGNGAARKRKSICMVAQNAHSLRVKLVERFQAEKIHVDCGGSLLNNIGYNVASKHDFLLDYCFNICPENSYAPGYCTEKIYDALQAGCLPIYWGDASCDQTVFNTNKILQVAPDCGNIDDIVQRCALLLNNRPELDLLLRQPSFDMAALHRNKTDVLQTVTNRLHSLCA